MRLAGPTPSKISHKNTCTYVEPLSGTYRDHELVELPPNGQGATALLILAMLQKFDLASLDPLGAARAHLEAEAAKLAYDARDRFIADPDHMGDLLDRMLSPATVDGLADTSSIRTGPCRVFTAAAAEAVHKDTVYLTVVDRDRMAVSLIYSIFHSFGSGIASERYHIMFQNRGAGFNLTPGHPNEAGPGKRPMHTIIPGMLRRDGQLLMPFGVMGGPYQPAGHARLVSNVVDYGMGLQAAIDAPRTFPLAGELHVEAGYGADTPG